MSNTTPTTEPRLYPAWRATLEELEAAGIAPGQTIDRCVETAGQMVGLGDFRPRFGRFEVTAKH